MNIHQNHDSGGVIARSYDCVFCQRGFTTAQALGGHMNIHRKDRATNNNNNKTTLTKKHDVVISNKQGVSEDDNYNYDHNYHVNDSTRLLLFSPIKSITSQFHEERLNLFGSPSRAWVGDSSSKIGSTMVGKTSQDIDHGEEGEELDLELRLGHYPW